MDALSILIATLVGGFGGYLASYFTQKGKNLATREDIGKITRAVEEVRLELQEPVETRRVHNQLRIASLNRRLRAHQRSFAMWRRLTGAEEKDFYKALMDCQAFWENNCLYLEPGVRQAFLVAYQNEHMRREFLRIRADSSDIMAAFAKVQEFPKALFDAVQLPPLSEAEVKALDTDSKRSSSAA